MRLLLVPTAAIVVLATVGARPASAEPPPRIRVAHYNLALYGDAAGEVATRLASGDDEQAIRLSRVIQSVRPDVLLLCEIDHDADGQTLDWLADRYLAVDQPSLDVDGVTTKAIDYPHRWSIPSNTGLLSPFDLNRDGRVSLPLDAWGFGKYPGQYAMAVLSRFPMDRDAIRTFQTYRWSEMPDALRPVYPTSSKSDASRTSTAAGKPVHSDGIWRALRLSSKNHVDVPIRLGDQTLHLLASHPTPPVFDGPEDLNGCRNHDEIRFWSDYLKGDQANHLIDDRGSRGGLAVNESFVIAGDLNSDPVAGDSRREAIVSLLAHPRVKNTEPSSPAHGTQTARFGSRPVRVDYVLPSRNLSISGSGVVWPGDQASPQSVPSAKDVEASDHRLVWVEIALVVEKPSAFNRRRRDLRPAHRGSP